VSPESAPVPAFPAAQRRREAAKSLARAFARIAILPWYLSYRCRRLVIGEGAFRGSSQLLSLIPGIVGEYLRREFYRMSLLSCSPRCCISFGTIFSTNQVTMADYVYVRAYCTVGDVDIETNVLIGSGVHLLSGKSQHEIARLDLPIRLQPHRLERIRIGTDSWIGNAAVLLAIVGAHCIVGAGSVVVSDVPAWCIVAGNPARVVRQRTAESTSLGAP
jgi:virginiamycin A acetyltransferase